MKKIIFIDQANAKEAVRRLGLKTRGTIFIIPTAAKRELTIKHKAN